MKTGCSNLVNISTSRPMHVMPWWTYHAGGGGSERKELLMQERALELLFRGNKPTGFLSACKKKSIKTRLGGSQSLSRGHSLSPPALKPTLASWGYKGRSGIPSSRPPPPPPTHWISGKAAWLPLRRFGSLSGDVSSKSSYAVAVYPECLFD